MNRRAAGQRSVREYRERMRRSGLRLVQLWVPDTRDSDFAKECRRQSRLASRKKSAENVMMKWIEANSNTEGWTE